MTILEINKHGSISLDNLAQKLDQVQLVDVRSQDEWDNGHFENALFMPLDQFPDLIDQLDPHKPTAFICAKGLRAALAWKIYNEHFPDTALNGYIVASADYQEQPTLKELPNEWHQEILLRLQDM